MRVALDTNIMVYAEGVDGEARRMAALDAISGLDPADVIVPVQALGELYRVLTGKARRPPIVAQASVIRWMGMFATVETSTTAFVDAIKLSVRHQFVIWDAIILSAAASAGCRQILSEDMQDGFTWRGVTIRNPFARATP